MQVLPTSTSNHLTAIRLAFGYLRAARGELVLNDRPGGLFSLYCEVLGGLLVSDRLGCSLRLNFLTGDYRTPGCAVTGWWKQFFESDTYNPERYRSGKSSTPPTTKESVRFAHLGVGMDRKLAFELSQRLVVRKELLEEIEAFTLARFSTDPVVGIHYRGTDKLLAEAERIPYQTVTTLLSKLDPRIRFFVATDEQPFLDNLIETFGERVIFREQHRSSDGIPVHHFDATGQDTGYTRGKDAIIDAYILSRCLALIRTPSNLSLVSTFLNPNIPVLILMPDTMSRPPIKQKIRELENAVFPNH